MFKLLIVGLLVLFCGIGIGLYYQGAVKDGIGPDSILYPLKSAWEWTQLNVLTWSESGKLELRLTFMQNSLDELSHLATSNNLTKEYAQKIEDKYTELASTEKEALSQQAKKASDTATKAALDKMNTIVNEQQKSLQEILSNSPGLVESPLQNAFLLMQEAYQKAVGATQGN